MTGQDAMAVLGLVSSGLMSGLFFAWEVSVIPGLLRVDDRTYVLSMQSINRAILNPMFLLPFLLTPGFLVAAGVLAEKGAVTWMVSAVVYGVGVLGVTMTRNVPFNNELDQFDIDTTDELLSAARHRYEKRWNRWNRLRTVAALASFLLAAATAVDSFSSL